MNENQISADEQQRLVYETMVYREQLNMLQREMDRITLATVDLNNAAKTTENISAGNSLIPIGGGAFIKAEVIATKVLVPVGAGYLIEMEGKEAETELKKRIDATERAVEKLSEEFKNLSKKFHDSSAKLREMQTQAALNKKVNENIGEDYL